MSYGARPFQDFEDEVSDFRNEFFVSEAAKNKHKLLADFMTVARTSVSYSDVEQDLFTLWIEIALRVNKLAAVDKIVDNIVENKSRYTIIEAATGVPWFVIAVVHSLEGSLNFKTHLHNGDPLTARTVQVPAGRPTSGKPPFSWEESAIDAIRFDGLDKVSNWNIERILYEFEKFNGFGYRKHHPSVKSPYVWSFSNHYTKGKYIADGSWSSEAVSKQCGAAVIPPKMNGVWCRIYAAICCFICRFNFWAGVTPPRPMLGRSLLYVQSHCVA